MYHKSVLLSAMDIFHFVSSGARCELNHGDEVGFSDDGHI